MELVIQLIDCSWRKCSSLITLRSFIYFIFHFFYFIWNSLISIRFGSSWAKFFSMFRSVEIHLWNYLCDICSEPDCLSSPFLFSNFFLSSRHFLWQALSAKHRSNRSNAHETEVTEAEPSRTPEDSVCSVEGQTDTCGEPSAVSTSKSGNYT